MVVEEDGPVVEPQLRSMGVATKGKLDGFFPKYGELDVGKVAACLAKASTSHMPLPSLLRRL